MSMKHPEEIGAGEETCWYIGEVLARSYSSVSLGQVLRICLLYSTYKYVYVCMYVCMARLTSRKLDESGSCM